MEKSIEIQVESLCKLHSLKLTHLCLSSGCSCPEKLCERCLIEHEQQYQNSNTIAFQNYYTKIDMEIQIFLKQYNFLQNQSATPSQTLTNVNQKFSQLANTQVFVLENSMKFLNEETKSLFVQIGQKQLQFTSSYEKLNASKKSAHTTFFKQINAKNLVEHCVGLYSQSGWTKFRAKMEKMMDFKDSISIFLDKTAGYGKNSKQSLIKSIQGQLSMRQSISQLILSKNSGKKPSQNKSKNSQNTQNSVQKRKRAKTIFGRN